MKLSHLFVSAVLGLFLGTSIAVANASTSTTPPVSAPRPVAVGEVQVGAGVAIDLPEVTVVGKAEKKARVPRAGKSKTWTCSSWQESLAGGQYKSCEWK